MPGYQPLCGNKACLCYSGFTVGTDCLACANLETTLLQVFGFSSFRRGQLDAIVPSLHGRDTFVRMATGGGKSICMFITPLLYSSTACAVIISPLNSLMDEQVRIHYEII